MTGLRVDTTVYCEQTHPDDGHRCELPAGGHQEHVYTEWQNGEIAGPVWWSEAPITLTITEGGTAPNPWVMRRQMDEATTEESEGP